MSGYNNVNVKEASEMVKEDDIFILDVRTPSEFNSSHLKGATLIPLTNTIGLNLKSDQLLETRIDEVPKNKKVLVYCRTGRRSEAASKMLANAGYLEIYNMVGGINAWKDEGFPVVDSARKEIKS
ncbi:MAG: rhodanese-like domain-containing protein [Methanosarcina sp.]